ncbi:male accessory gland serine protease inhibitor-like [Drosophila innubila]|uniref:male accessory gland serine protease inhibitor-like n=1 Tax=Drosophila innubila TaxID=198719 RepID=UPI00148B43D7|nr:male accessory gland serine protease inhibitor-like [Drosophila innubila]XP_034474071.1 male accessory gland serine protease inhibitor-like [Drosophila innubila]
MKFILVLACLALYVADIQAQICRGLPLIIQNCRNGANSGHQDGLTCRLNSNNNMWYYNSESRECLSMSYLGCGGNNNRYCTKRQCERSCIRRS